MLSELLLQFSSHLPDDHLYALRPFPDGSGGGSRHHRGGRRNRHCGNHCRRHHAVDARSALAVPLSRGAVRKLHSSGGRIAESLFNCVSCGCRAHSHVRRADSLDCHCGAARHCCDCSAYAWHYRREPLLHAGIRDRRRCVDARWSVRRREASRSRKAHRLQVRRRRHGRYDRDGRGALFRRTASHGHHDGCAGSH